MYANVRQSGAPLTSLFTSVLWTVCVAVGVAGLLWKYPRVVEPKREPPPVAAQRIQVQITPDRLPAMAEAAAPSPSPLANSAATAQPPPPPEAAAPPPDAPPLAAVATPSPSISFAVPVDKPARLVDAKQAMPAGPTEVAATAATPVQHLTYGRGEGQQPAPIYPREAALARQQGTVLVRFTVDRDGNVIGAEPVAPSPWPLLNQAALRAVRDTWHFQPGPPRAYEVSIEFQLKER
jgi:protein TonB